VPEVKWVKPGEDAGRAMLDKFIETKARKFAEDRNKFALPDASSNVSPFLHYGQLSAQRCILEARRARARSREGMDAFIEELYVRVS
jgi:deoxyribodipyrimidine photo-lyase